MKLIGVLVLCTAASVVRAREEAVPERLPIAEAHLMRVPSTTTTTTTSAPANGVQADSQKKDCESMDMCNLPDAVPGNNGPKFTDMAQQEKLKVCRSLKTALDCSSLYTCDRLTRLVKGGERFFNLFCTKIFKESGLAFDNCVRDAHIGAVDRCAHHLEKMKALANHVSPNEDSVRQACCEHRTYTDCYRREVSEKCSMDPSQVPLHPDRRVDTYCSKDFNKDTATLCREQRQLNFDSVPAGISASSALRGFHALDGGIIPSLVMCFAVMVLRAIL